MVVPATAEWIEVLYKLLQLVGFATAVKGIAWLVSFRKDFSELKDNHVHTIETSMIKMVEQSIAHNQQTNDLLNETKEMRQDIRELVKK